MSTSQWSTWSPPGAPFPFATAIDGADWCLVCEAGHDPATGGIPGSVEEQTRLAVQKASARFDEAGFSLDEIVYVRPYVTAREHAPLMDGVLAELLPDPKPASGALVICELIDPRMKMEIELVAYRGAVKRPRGHA